MPVWTSLRALTVFATVSHFSVFSPSTFGQYGASTFFAGAGGGRSGLPLEATLPYRGWVLIVAAGALLVGASVLFVRYVYRADERAKTWGHILLKAALVAQGLGIVTLVSQLK